MQSHLHMHLPLPGSLYLLLQDFPWETLGYTQSPWTVGLTLMVVPLLFFLSFLYPKSTVARHAATLCRHLYMIMDLVEAIMAIYLLDSQSSVLALFAIIAFVPFFSACIEKRLKGMETVWDKLVFGILSEAAECWAFMYMAGCFQQSGDDTEAGAATFLGNGTLLAYTASESRDLAEHVFPAMAVFQVMALMMITLKERLGETSPFMIAFGKQVPPPPVHNGDNVGDGCGFGVLIFVLGMLPIILLNFGKRSPRTLLSIAVQLH